MVLKYENRRKEKKKKVQENYHKIEKLRGKASKKACKLKKKTNRQRRYKSLQEWIKAKMKDKNIKYLKK